jgi:WD40 repeat protein/class 3 adenylate cyclase/serine/threonine protein kinase
MDVSPLSSRLMVLMFTDVVNSAGIKADVGAEAYGTLVARQDRIVHHTVSETPGAQVLQDTGDGYFIAFPNVGDAIEAALRYQYRMAKERWGPEPLRARVGLHLGQVAQLASETTGQPKVFASAVDLAARVMSLAEGGQILLTRVVFDEARQFVREHPKIDGQHPAIRWVAHGPYLFKGADEPMDVYEVGAEGIAPLTPPPDQEKARRHIRPGEEATLGWRPGADRTLPGASNWIIRQKLGEGGFGEVWLAQHEKTKAFRVFKFCFDALRLRALKREVVLFRLIKEALGARRDIGRVVDWQFSTAPYFIEMDYAPDGNLVQWSAAQGGIANVPLAARLTIVAQVAEALGAAHSVGILHKDIKPSNVLMVQDLEGTFYARLTDFGIGILTDRARLGDYNITMTGFTSSTIAVNESSRSGTQMYAPPESLAGKPHSVQGDVYALGVLLYQMVVADLEKPLAPGWERDVDDDLLRIDIAACVDGDPQSRLQSAQELAQRLVLLEQRRDDVREQIEAAQREEETQRRAAEAARIAERRHRVIKLMSAGLAVLTIIAGSFSILIWQLAVKSRAAHISATDALIQKRHAEEEAIRAHAAEIKAEAAAADAVRAGAQARQHLAAEYVARGQELRTTGNNPALALPFFVRALREESFEPEAATVHRMRIGLTLDQCLTPCGPLVGLDEQLPISPDPRLTATDWRVLVRRDPELGRAWGLSDRNGNNLAEFTHAKRIMSASLSPDGKRVVTAGEDMTARVWNARDGKPITGPLKHADTVLFAAFSPDGKRVVTACKDGTARVWDATTGDPISEPMRHAAAVQWAAFSPDGRLLVTGGQDNAAHVWDASSGKALTPELPHSQAITFIEFSPNGERFLTTCDDHAVRIFNARTGITSGALLKHNAAINSAAFSADSKRVVTAGQDSTARVWNADTGAPIGKTIDHADWVWHATFSPDGKRIVTACRDGSAQIWNIETGETVGPRVQHRGPVRSAVFTPDGLRLITEVWDMGLFVWNVPARFAPAPDAALEIAAVDFAIMDPHGLRLAVLGGLQPPTLFDARGGQRLAKLEGHKGLVNVAAFSDAGALATAGEDRTAIVWNTDTAAPLFAPLKHKDRVKLVAFDGKGRRLVTATADGTVRAFDARTGAPLTAGVRFEGGDEVLAFSPDARRYLVLKQEGTTAAEIHNSFVVVCDTDTGKPVSAPMRHQGKIHHAAFSHDGKLVVTASNDHTARVWDAGSGEARTQEPLRHENPVFYASFSPDDARVVTGSQDRTARVWDVATGRPLTPPMLHEGPCIVRRAIFSPDGCFVATATDYYAARIWDARNGQPVSGWLEHPKFIEQIAFTPDSRRLISLCERKLRVWNLPADQRPIDELQKFAELLSGRMLDETGGESPLRPEQFIALSKELTAAYPASFLPPATPELATAALANKNLDARLLTALGDWYATNRANESAVKFYEAARRRGQTIDVARLAYCYWSAGDDGGAIEAFTSALGASPSPVLREHLERCINFLKNHRNTNSASAPKE